jgi:hypothetical protein
MDQGRTVNWREVEGEDLELDGWKMKTTGDEG